VKTTESLEVLANFAADCAADDRTPIEELRSLVKAFDGNTESFNADYSLEQLLLIRRAWKDGEWDVFPDQWPAPALAAALMGDQEAFDAAMKAAAEEEGW
jgi:hypothetical protein